MRVLPVPGGMAEEAGSAASAVRVSCCVIARGRLEHLRRTLAGLARQRRCADEVVVVAMGDPEVARIATNDPVVTTVEVLTHDPGEPLPLARARNRAAALTAGELLVFLDVDCIGSPCLVADYVAQRRPGLLIGSVRYLPPGVPDRLAGWSFEELDRHGRRHPARPAPTVPERTDRYELFWSLNFAVERSTWTRLGGFDENFTGYGGEDTDLAFQARRRGIPAWFLAGADAFHQHHASQDPPVEHLHDIVANARRFHDKWGTWPMTGWLRAFADDGLIEWDSGAIRLTVGAVAP